MTRNPLMIIPLEAGIAATRRWRGVAGKLVKLYPNLKVDLAESDLNVEADEYIAAAVLSALATGAIAFLLLFSTLTLLKANPERTLIIAVSSSAIITVMFLFVLIIYPNILAGKKAELLERDLIYALKDMLLEVSAGASVYTALTRVSESGYGEASKEFQGVVGKVNVGVPVDDALSTLAVKSKSDHMRHSVWQIVNAMKSGSSVEGALRELVKELTVDRKNKIRSYAQELNIMILVYMLFAVIIPTITTTLIIILGPFIGVRMGPRIFYLILPACFFVQVVLMEFIKSRRPVVHI